jgi:hypothetical protein
MISNVHIYMWEQFQNLNLNFQSTFRCIFVGGRSTGGSAATTCSVR